MLDRGLRDHERAYLGEVRARLPRTGDAAADYAANLMYRSFPVLFDQLHLAHVTGTTSQALGLMRVFPEQFYSTFRIRKRRGGSRLIASPAPALKNVQTWLHLHLTRNLWTHPSCHGFVKGKSIITNALPHVGSEIVLKLDIAEFFPSVKRDRVYRIFRRIGYSPALSDLLAGLTTLRDSLPQGAPTSPDLANFAAYGLDARLASLAETAGLSYTRYADDLTFSGRALRYKETKRLIQHIMRDEGFTPNEQKVRFLRSGSRLQITGIVVNEKPNWPRPLRRWLRQEVYFLRRFGVEEHLERRNVDRRRYKEFIYGHVFALKAIRPSEAEDLLGQLDEVAWDY